MLGRVCLEVKGRRCAIHGFGSFFDDEIHGLFGICDLSWQSLYLFTRRVVVPVMFDEQERKARC
jgi:hypothetical protein